MTTIPDVPWAIEGGAKHTVQVGRNLAYMAAGGTEGIVLGADLEVRENAVPDGNVRVFPGTFVVQNRAAGAFSEAYVDRISSELQVPIAPTDASGGRNDLIVARIENPYASGETWPDPVDPQVGPYASIAVISGVNANVNSADDLGLSADHSMIALARVEIPASTGTITQDMIVDLRVMAGSVNKREFEIVEPTTTDALSTAGYSIWPSEVNLSLDIPAWATHAKVRAILAGATHGGPGTTNVFGDLRFRIGGTSGDFFSSACRYDLDNDGGIERDTLVVADNKVGLPKEDRGRKGVSFQLQGRKLGGDNNLKVDAKSTVSIEVEFINEPESNI